MREEEEVLGFPQRTRRLGERPEGCSWLRWCGWTAKVEAEGGGGVKPTSKDRRNGLNCQRAKWAPWALYYSKKDHAGHIQWRAQKQLRELLQPLPGQATLLTGSRIALVPRYLGTEVGRYAISEGPGAIFLPYFKLARLPSLAGCLCPNKKYQT